VTPLSVHTRLRLRALGVYTLAIVMFAIPYLATFIAPLGYAVGMVVAVIVAAIWLGPAAGGLAWHVANWRAVVGSRAVAGSLALYFTTIGVGTTLLLACHHPVAWAGGAVVLAGGAAFEWFRITPPQSVS
jgi:hypothetical protein